MKNEAWYLNGVPIVCLLFCYVCFHCNLSVYVMLIYYYLCNIYPNFQSICVKAFELWKGVLTGMEMVSEKTTQAVQRRNQNTLHAGGRHLCGVEENECKTILFFLIYVLKCHT